MAISFKNVITKLYSGRVGDIVLRNYGGKSVMAKRPDCSKVIKSPAQLENQKKFAKAVRSSKTLKNNPQRFEYYNKKKKKKIRNILVNIINKVGLIMLSVFKITDANFSNALCFFQKFTTKTAVI